MKQTGLPLNFIWEEMPAPDAAERIAAAFTMLLGSWMSREMPPEQGLDSQS